MFSLAYSSPAALAISLANAIARDHKGGSIYPGGIAPKVGYIVRHESVNSLMLKTRSVNRVRLFEPNSTATNALLVWCRSNWQTIKNTDCVGYWMAENGDMYIDCNRVITDLDKAIAHGEKLGELALYDLAKKREVPLIAMTKASA